MFPVLDQVVHLGAGALAAGAAPSWEQWGIAGVVFVILLGFAGAVWRAINVIHTVYLQPTHAAALEHLRAVTMALEVVPHLVADHAERLERIEAALESLRRTSKPPGSADDSRPGSAGPGG